MRTVGISVFDEVEAPANGEACDSVFLLRLIRLYFELVKLLRWPPVDSGKLEVIVKWHQSP